MNQLRNFGFLAVLLALTGCATMTTKTTNSIVASWQGQPIAAVIAQWGTPLHRYEAAGGAMYQWTDSERLVPWKLGVDRELGQETPGTALVRGTCTRQLNTDSAGVVTGGEFLGDNCCVMAVAGYCKSLVRHPVAANYDDAVNQVLANDARRAAEDRATARAVGAVEL